MAQRLGLLTGLLVAAPLGAAGMEVPETARGADAALHGDVVRDGFDVTAWVADLVHALPFLPRRP